MRATRRGFGIRKSVEKKREGESEADKEKSEGKREKRVRRTCLEKGARATRPECSVRSGLGVPPC